MTDFAVVPGSLRRMADELEDATERLSKLAERVSEWTMNSWDLGPVGVLAGYPSGYDQAKTMFADKIGSGASRLGKVGPVLHEVADHYLAKDAQYYHEFGYVGDKLTQRGA